MRLEADRLQLMQGRPGRLICLLRHCFVRSSSAQERPCSDQGRCPGRQTQDGQNPEDLDACEEQTRPVRLTFKPQQERVARSQETEDHQKNSEDSQHHTYQARDASLAEYVSPSARSAGSRSI